MHTTSLLRLLALATAAAGLAAPALAQPTEIYREIFGRTGADVPITNYGWIGYRGATAILGTTANFSVTAEIGGSASNLAQSLPINSGALTTIDRGRTLLGSGAGGIFLAYTEEYEVNRSVHAITSFTWDQRDNNAAGLGVAVRINNLWYASNTASFTPGDSPSVWGSATLDFSTATWSSLTFTPTTELSVGATTTLPGGNITAFGVYAPGSRPINTNARIDGFTINATAIPEPSSVAALAGAAGLGAAGLRRRRR